MRRLETLTPKELGLLFEHRSKRLIEFLLKSNWNNPILVYGNESRTIEDGILELLLEIQNRHSDREEHENKGYDFADIENRIEGIKQGSLIE